MPLVVFIYIGGYGEEMLPCGYQDQDLVLRAVRLGEAVKVLSAEMVWFGAWQLKTVHTLVKVNYEKQTLINHPLDFGKLPKQRVSGVLN